MNGDKISLESAAFLQGHPDAAARGNGTGGQGPRACPAHCGHTHIGCTSLLGLKSSLNPTQLPRQDVFTIIFAWHWPDLNSSCISGGSCSQASTGHSGWPHRSVLASPTEMVLLDCWTSAWRFLWGLVSSPPSHDIQSPLRLKSKSYVISKGGGATEALWDGFAFCPVCSPVSILIWILS